MKEVRIEHIEHLKSFLTKYSSQFLFRGQTRHYLNSSDKISISTSFNRHECIPPLMFKWSHYAKALISAFGEANYHNVNTELSQAILQHYGWRSFFIDLSKAPHIACWFAANKYQEDKVIHLCEDFEESPVHLVYKEASFVDSYENGHLYIIDPKILKDQDVKIHDLTKIESDEGILRFHAQHACLAGSRNGELPYKSIAFHIEVKHQVLVDYYQEKGIRTTLDVFPDRENDFILKSLLDIPWNKIRLGGKHQIPFFMRGLEIPEYDSMFVKHLNPKVTLFSEFWISQNRCGPNSPFVNIPFYGITEHAYYANTNKEFDLSEVNKILVNHEGFVIELDGLIKILEQNTDYEYEKGIFVEKLDNNIISVSGLIIEHPGQKVVGISATKGWYYKIENGLSSAKTKSVIKYYQ